MPETWLFAASLLLLVTGLDAQGCQYVRYQNTNIYGGNLTTDTTLTACQASCEARPGCQGIDWEPGSSRCFLQGKQTDKNYNIQGVDHYDRICPGGQGCQFIYYRNTNIYGGNQTSDTTLGACQAACQARPGCQGIDWEPGSSRCFLQGKQTDKNSNIQGVDHYDLVCNGSTQIPVSFSTTIVSGTGCNFVRYDNTNIYGGSMNPAMSESACQDACRAMAGCQGIDWSPSNPSGQQCFLHNKMSPKNSVSGVTHYDYICSGTTQTTLIPPPPPSTECKTSAGPSSDTSSLGGYNVPEIRDILMCYGACQQIIPCLGLDFSSSTGCWIHYNTTSFPQKFYQPGVTQIKLTRCPEEGISNCMPSYDNNGVLTETCASACYPKWMRLDNTAGSGGQVNYNVGQRNFSACLKYCFDRSDCVGVDYSEVPGNPSVCTYYLSSQSSALYNVTTKAYVTQYRIVNRCYIYCTAYYEQKDNVRYRLRYPTPYAVYTQPDCERRCRLSETCVAYQFNKSGPGSPSCMLADSFYDGSGVTDYSVYTGLYRQNCNKTTPPPTPPASGSCNFVRYDNTNIYGGAMNPAMSESACQDACRAMYGCQGIDWSQGSPAGQQCFIHNKTSGKNYNVNGVTHYDYSCSGSGSTTMPGSVTGFPSTTPGPPGTCYWSPANNTQILGGNQAVADTVDACKQACLSRPGCVSIDFTPNNPSGSRCYLLATSNGKVPSQSGTIHYDYVCPNNTCWQKYPDTRIYGGQQNPSTSLYDCWKACTDLGKQLCASVDWSNINTAGSQCYILNTQLGKTPNQPGVDHYDYIC